LVNLTDSAPTPYKVPQSVLVLIHTAQLDVLLIERCDGDALWQSVTGSLDDEHESFLDAARRELFEETGFNVSPDQLIDWHQHCDYAIFPRWLYRYAPGVTHNREFVFSVCLADCYSPTLSPREHRAFEWLPYQQAAQRCFSPSNQQAILQLPDRMKHIDPLNIYFRKV
jgi:dATP pyrophosphohydrolase